MGKSKISFFRRNKIIIVFFIIFFSYVGYTLFMNEEKNKELEYEAEQYDKEIAALKEQIEGLKLEIEKSQSHEVIEKIAREKLKMVKPNEIIYIIQDNNTDVESSDKTEVESTEKSEDSTSDQ